MPKNRSSPSLGRPLVSDIPTMSTGTSIRIGPGAGESDGALMRRVQANDPGALEELYERHAARALREALAICHDPDRAEDAVQEAFVGVWRGRFGYQPSAASFVDWAMSIVRQRALDATRE
jgi:DNA-directed RNA polymerase specialized sigma24 family protein